MITKNLYLLLFIRLNSKRLKNKGFMKIGKLKVIEIIIARCLKSISKKNIIITTTNNKIDDKIFNFAKKKKIKIFRGSENNVRKRTIDCCNKFKIKSFIRMNCDRPFMNYKQLTKMIKIFTTNKYDIKNNYCNNICVIDISSYWLGIVPITPRQIPVFNIKLE